MKQDRHMTVTEFLTDVHSENASASVLETFDPDSSVTDASKKQITEATGL
jgi:hypothetical protein